MLDRPDYLQSLLRWKDNDLIKVVTGIRRCGKSTLFSLYQDYLRQNGVAARQIIAINLEDLTVPGLTNYQTLNKHILKRLAPRRKNYVFLDEIQQVTGAQKILASLRLKKNVDLYVTGSNAYLLSSKIATLLSGRYIEIKMLPLSFKEYTSAFPKNALDLSQKYQDYVRHSAFPQTLNFAGDEQRIQDYMRSIYSTIVARDVLLHKEIKDASRLNSVAQFMFDNIGSETSIRNIANTMTYSGRKMHPQTIEVYLNGLLDSFILYKASRYDIKGKQYLLTNAKYYLADAGLKYALLGKANPDDGHVLENVVYLELLRRGYAVHVGKIGATEVDFIAVKPGQDPEYYQVAQTVLDENVLQRELKSLQAIRDNFPKFLLTRDTAQASHQGIQQQNVLNWLLGKE